VIILLINDAPICTRKETECENKLSLNQLSSLTVDSLYGLKLFVTNRSTRLDFPTPESPNNTTCVPEIQRGGQINATVREQGFEQPTFTSRGFASISLMLYEKESE
jgi:hypothetical protein